jgi:hypothetical protein
LQEAYKLTFNANIKKKDDLTGYWTAEVLSRKTNLILRMTVTSAEYMFGAANNGKVFL